MAGDNKDELTTVGVAQFLSTRGILHAIVYLTATGLKKCTLDATLPVREFLLRTGIHDYSRQAQGPEFKVVVPGCFLTQYRSYQTKISFNRPRSGNGDPRMWIRGLRNFVSAGEPIVLAYANDELVIFKYADKSVAAMLKPSKKKGIPILTADSGASSSQNKIVRQTMEHRNKVVRSIYGRGFGGETAVVVPGALDDQLPSAKPAAGVIETCDYLLDSLRGSGAPVWVFLIGGPGNGKSHVLNQVLNRLNLKMTSMQGGLAPRSELLDLKSSSLLVVNDASIRPSETTANGGPGDLAQDLQMLFSDSKKGKRTSALVCINRGILIEELSRVPDLAAWKQERDLLEWLNSDYEYRDSEEDCSGDFFKIRKIGVDNPTQIMGVFLDRLSLLEKQPLSIDADKSRFENYQVLFLADRARLRSPAGELLENLVGRDKFEGAECDGCPAQHRCPFLANARSIRSNAIRLGILDTVRASEVVSGHLSTYRDLWALFAALVIGGDRQEFSSDHPCKWVLDTDAAIGEDDYSDKEKLLDLGRQRFYEAIYPSQTELMIEGVAGGWTEIPPAVERLRTVDPALDSCTPWAEAVDAATEAVAFKQLPLESIVEDNPGFSDAIAPLDQKIGKMMVAQLIGDSEDYSEVDRRRILRWRGLSLYRHFGFAMGHPAHETTVRQWLQLRRVASNKERDLPLGPLQAALNQLILPTSEHDPRYCLLPIFEPRVEPLAQVAEKAKWCQALQAAALVRWRIYARGDGLWLRLWVAGRDRPVSEFPLDFSLCREALAQCVENSFNERDCMPGFTERRSTVSPRLERVRASFLAAAAGLERNVVIAHSKLSYVNLPQA